MLDQTQTDPAEIVSAWLSEIDRALTAEDRAAFQDRKSVV